MIVIFPCETQPVGLCFLSVLAVAMPSAFLQVKANDALVAFPFLFRWNTTGEPPPPPMKVAGRFGVAASASAGSASDTAAVTAAACLVIRAKLTGVPARPHENRLTRGAVAGLRRARGLTARVAEAEREMRAATAVRAAALAGEPDTDAYEGLALRAGHEVEPDPAAGKRMPRADRHPDPRLLHPAVIAAVPGPTARLRRRRRELPHQAVEARDVQMRRLPPGPAAELERARVLHAARDHAVLAAGGVDPDRLTGQVGGHVEDAVGADGHVVEPLRPRVGERGDHFHVGRVGYPDAKHGRVAREGLDRVQVGTG